MSEIERLITMLARLPGLGPRSARRAALALVKKRESLLEPLARALDEAAKTIRACVVCGGVCDDDSDVLGAAGFLGLGISLTDIASTISWQ